MGVGEKDGCVWGRKRDGCGRERRTAYPGTAIVGLGPPAVGDLFLHHLDQLAHATRQERVVHGNKSNNTQYSIEA